MRRSNNNNNPQAQHPYTLASSPIQLIPLLPHQRPQIPIRHAIHRLIHHAKKTLAPTIPQPPILGALLQKLALPVPHPRARHIPRQHLQHRQALCVQPRGIDRHADRLPVVAVLPARVRVVEEQLAGGVFFEEGGEEGAEGAVGVREVVEAEGGEVVAAVPEGVADVVLVVAFARGEGVGEFVLGAVGGERLDVGVEGDGRVDVVAREGGGDDVRVEAVEEVLLLIRQGGARGGEVALAGEGEEGGRVRHDGRDGLVEVALHGLDEVAEAGFQVRHLHDLRLRVPDRVEEAADLREG